MLRGVYEDNLRTTRKVAPDMSPEAPRSRGKRWPLAAVVVLPALVILFFQFVFPVLSGGSQGRPIGPLTAAGSPTYSLDGDSSLPDASSYNNIAANPDLPLATLFDLQIKTIVIDPGHGGKDPGAVGHLGIREKDITLDVARRLKHKLEARTGFKVILTREDDTFLSLRERVLFANNHQADLFISVHVNYLPIEPLSVVETYYFGPQSDEATLQLARKENQNSDYSTSDFNDMIKRIGNTMRLQESKRTAMSIQKSLYRNMRQINRNVNDWGVKTAPFVVLLGVEAPSVLAEIACLSNRDEEAKLNTAAHREKIALFLEEGIVNYLKQRPSKNDSPEGATRNASQKNQSVR